MTPGTYRKQHQNVANMASSDSVNHQIPATSSPRILLGPSHVQGETTLFNMSFFGFGHVRKKKSTQIHLLMQALLDHLSASGLMVKTIQLSSIEVIG